jgi:hypothetical protein
MRKLCGQESRQTQTGKLPVLLEPLWSQDRSVLKYFAAILNDAPAGMTSEEHGELVKLVELWSDQEFDWLDHSFWQRRRISPDNLRLKLDRALQLSLMPGRGRRMHLISSRSQSVSNEPSPNRAHALFARLLLDSNPEFWGGRCRRCRQFYVKKTRGQNVYCSPECRGRRPTKEYKATTRKNTKKRILEIVHLKCEAYCALTEGQRKRIQDSRGWVVAQSNEMLILENREPITVKWITRNEVTLP